MPLDRLSIELTNRCTKGCWFCYNHSHVRGETRWAPAELIGFLRDCADHGVRAVSFGGGEPLQYEGLAEVLGGLRGVVFRSLTTNGLLLDQALDRLVAAAPDKVHVSIHFPQRPAEVERVIGQVHALAGHGLASGINLLVARSSLEAAGRAAEKVRAAGIGNDRIVYLPMRGQDTPTPQEMAHVAGGGLFQTMTCLGGCASSPRFCSIGWDRSVGWCSYTSARRLLPELTYAGLRSALDGLGLTFCGDGRPSKGQGAMSLPLVNQQPDAPPGLARVVVVVPGSAADFPAAHSMDATWCAIDRNGYLGMFFTGEGGFLPTESGDLEGFFSFVRALRGEPEPEEDDEDWDEAESQAADAGLFLFQYIEGDYPLVENYHAMFEELHHPRHVSQLLPAFRRQFKQVRLSGIDFPQARIVQPIEHVPIDKLYFYYEDPPAYLASDEKTVRPIPGKEDRFAEFVREFQRTEPERAAQLHFEGFDASTPTPPVRRRKRKKGGDQP